MAGQLLARYKLLAISQGPIANASGVPSQQAISLSMVAVDENGDVADSPPLSQTFTTMSDDARTFFVVGNCYAATFEAFDPAQAGQQATEQAGS